MIHSAVAIRAAARTRMAAARRLARCLTAIAIAPAGLTGLAGCADSGGSTTLTVLAASSMTDAMAELGTRYGQLYPAIAVQTSFGGSQELTAQVKDVRRSVDLLVTADGTSMDTVAQYVQDRRVVAHNSMTIAVAPGNPKHIQGLAGLADPALRVVLGAPNNPSGRYAQRILATAGISVTPKSMEIDSRTVLTRVRTGEADAGIVYVTDLRWAGVAASSVPIPVEQNVTAAYPAAVVKRSGHGEAATALLTWLASPQAQSIMAKYGFAAA